MSEQIQEQVQADSTRNRILAAAMRLFGEQGYAGTKVGQIEDAAGLSRGAGGIYRHFPSKEALLSAGITRAIDTGTDLVGLISSSDTLADLPFVERLFVVAEAGLERLDHDRNLNRLVVRDLAKFPELLSQVRNQEILRTHRAFAAWLRQQPEAAARSELDWDAIAAVLMGAASHYWLLQDTFGAHPTGLDQERYLRAAVALTAALVDRTNEDLPDDVT
jgi:AcrR family transcriptional regulator